MSLDTLLVYSIASFMLAITPGPTMLLTLSNGLSGGWRPAVFGMLGASTGSSLLIATAAAGLGAVMLTSESLFNAVRWAGVLYLCWLGLRLWQAEPVDLRPQGSEGMQTITPAKAYVRSLTVALSNPKTVIFFAAFLPQFVDATAPQGMQYAILGIVFVGIDSLVMVAYALAGARAGRLLSGPNVRLMNRGCGLGMWLLAASLAMWRR